MARQIEENEGNQWNELLEGPLDGELFQGQDNEPELYGQPPIHQHNLTLEGIDIQFPERPYQSQVEMMTNILRGLNGESNSLIESPTGSGKTLALLCAVLACRKHNIQNGIPSRKIFYCTKTHSQISTVVRELKRTIYGQAGSNQGLKVAILGSRKQTCCNDDVRSAVDVDTECKKLARNYRRNIGRTSLLPTCRYYHPKENDYLASQEQPQVIRDIEDLYNTGRNQVCCPFYGSRRQLPAADLVICPYNYIISDYIRESLNINLQNCVLIFDEGHNLEKTLCAEASMSFKLGTFQRIINQCTILNAGHPEGSSIRTATDNLVRCFESILARLNQHNNLEGEHVLNALNDAGLGRNDLNNVERDWKIVTDEGESNDGPILESWAAHRIQKIITCLRHLYNAENLEEQYFPSLSLDENDTKLNVICINPAVAFSNISNQTSSITITSGTLAPIESFSQELNVLFPYTTSLGQIIPRERYWVAKVGRNYIPKLTFENGEKERVIRYIGMLILRICEAVPNGVVCFFPSKAFLVVMMNGWQRIGIDAGNESIFDALIRLKYVVSELEMVDAQTTRQMLADYKRESRLRGSLLLGVHRGKLSEGTDFRDEEARAVVNIGIPYMPINCPENVAMERLDPANRWDWYERDAFRAVNQALGRSVRHINDWGAITMVDPRFSDKNELLPGWIQNACTDFNYFEPMIRSLTQFIDQMRNPNGN